MLFVLWFPTVIDVGYSISVFKTLSVVWNARGHITLAASIALHTRKCNVESASIHRRSLAYASDVCRENCGFLIAKFWSALRHSRTMHRVMHAYAMHALQLYSAAKYAPPHVLFLFRYSSACCLIFDRWMVEFEAGWTGCNRMKWSTRCDRDSREQKITTG